MADPFTQCPSANSAGFRCWLCLGHRGGIHETHPAERRKSREAGASPVWSAAGRGTGSGEVIEGTVVLEDIVRANMRAAGFPVGSAADDLAIRAGAGQWAQDFAAGGRAEDPIVIGYPEANDESR